MMASNNLAAFSTRNPVTPQGQKAVKGQKKNNAGGYTFVVSPLDRAKRFLILGSEDSFYMTGTKLTAQNAKNLIKLIEDGHSTELVDLIVTVSTEGRAAKQDPGVFALAVASAHGTVEERAYALSKLPEVARTATTLFMFIGFVQQFRGWGPALRRAVANWYLDKDADKLAFQVVKYRQREGYTHRDAFRLAHPKTTDAAVQGLGEWILRGTTDNAPKLVKGFVKAQKAGADLPKLIAKYNLTWEMLPTDALNDKKVWETLLADPKRVPLGALIRQLPRLSRIGITPPLGGMTEVIVERFADAEEIRRARLHPVNILVALKTYASGRSERGDSTWTPSARIVDALDKAFYLSFKTITPSGKKFLIGLDVSGSMSSSINGSSLSSRDVTAAFSLVLAATEKETHTIAFTGMMGGRNNRYYWGNQGEAHSSIPQPVSKYSEAVTVLNISPEQRLDDVFREVDNQPFGSTDCSLPMLYAMEQGLEVDTFLIMTDNDTYAGDIHVHEALRQYRQKTGIAAKFIVFSTLASRSSIADPNDRDSLDIAGFDSASVQIITEFSRGL